MVSCTRADLNRNPLAATNMHSPSDMTETLLPTLNPQNEKTHSTNIDLRKVINLALDLELELQLELEMALGLEMELDLELDLELDVEL
jgi:hypothetical protein